MRRETCICETPTRVADLRLREVLLEAQAQHLALAVGQHAHQPLDGRGVLGDARSPGPRCRPSRRCRRRPRRPRRAGGRARPRGRRPPPRGASSTCSVVAPIDSAISAGVGARPSSRPICSPTRSTLTASSCRSRGTRTDQPLSRKWRLSSPRIVGTANEENAVSRSRVEAVDRLQQAERRDLHEVVERLAAALVAAGELARERQEALDERVARGRIAALVVLHAAADDPRACARLDPRVTTAGLHGRAAGICLALPPGRLDGPSMKPNPIIHLTDPAPGG